MLYLAPRTRTLRAVPFSVLSLFSPSSSVSRSSSLPLRLAFVRPPCALPSSVLVPPLSLPLSARRRRSVPRAVRPSCPCCLLPLAALRSPSRLRSRPPSRPRPAPPRSRPASPSSSVVVSFSLLAPSSVARSPAPPGALARGSPARPGLRARLPPVAPRPRLSRALRRSGSLPLAASSRLRPPRSSSAARVLLRPTLFHALSSLSSCRSV